MTSRKRVWRVLALGCASVVVISASCVVLVLKSLEPATTVERRLRSPDGRWDLLVLSIDLGATGGATCMDLVQAHHGPDENWRIACFDWGREDQVLVEWPSPTHVRIKNAGYWHRQRDKVEFAEATIRVTFD